MATILYTGSYGSDDPTRATFPFHMALGAIDSGHQPQIALMGDATYLASQVVAENILGFGVPPLKELLAKAIEHKVPIYV